VDCNAPPPKAIFPELRDWQPAGMHDAVFRATRADGEEVYVRADDGSVALLRRLAREPDLPTPAVFDEREGWLVLEALPGVPLNDDQWLARPRDAVKVIADALLRLARNDITHGDMCLPNILGDLTTGGLSGVVDWRDAGQFDHEIDVASAIWACEFNGYARDVPVAVLDAIGWPRADATEVERLSRLWSELPDPVDS
jgi:aminoglycoside phosphotransferase